MDNWEYISCQQPLWKCNRSRCKCRWERSMGSENTFPPPFKKKAAIREEEREWERCLLGWRLLLLSTVPYYREERWLLYVILESFASFILRAAGDLHLTCWPIRSLVRYNHIQAGYHAHAQKSSYCRRPTCSTTLAQAQNMLGLLECYIL